MTFNYQKYYKEIKNRFILTFFAWMFCLSTSYYYKETILFALVDSSNLFLNSDEKPYFIFTNVTEVFYVYIQLILFISNQITVIILVYQVLIFLSLGLYQYELKRVKSLLQLFLLTWLAALFLLFNFVVPLTWKFFLSFQKDSTDKQFVSFFFEAKLSEYIQYFIDLYYVSLINCQFLVLLLIILNTVNEKLRKTKTFRKFFYLIFVIFSTIVTPPDVFSQIFISGVLIVIYECVILLKKIKTSMVTN
jgi:sec-independent protein translocase protein TatC